MSTTHREEVAERRALRDLAEVLQVANPADNDEWRREHELVADLCRNIRARSTRNRR